MGLGENGYTLASHSVLITLLMLMLFRYGRMLVSAERRSQMDWQELIPAITIFTLALVLERGYYAAARFLAHQGADLWMMHPVPTFLSVMVAVTVYAMNVPVMLAETVGRARWIFWTRIAGEMTLFISLWCAIGWWLY
ncbi:hypothetical protein [Thalassococcus sp. S3]|uniref:hypothetical protein n=1 Tax=Thalassococcus sp. S3 TaxID=2017482 RepID=UPI00102419F8|nr:hypothetical protein [Thalassococcus sp. S3]QBF31515.1 hypothetical protein CFI11_09840 [Thalassococcus sp. S3]